MVNKENTVFDNATLRRHHLYPGYHNSLHNISKKDYPNCHYFKSDIEGIDLDLYESQRAIANREMTMDAVIGIADYRGNRLVNSRLLLVELRMDYDSTKNLKYRSLSGKIQHSRLAIGREIRVDENSFFVFRDDIVEQAKKWMFSMSRENADACAWVAVSISGLDNLLHSPLTMPYQPETDMSEADSNMLRLIRAKDFESILDFLFYWNGIAESFKFNFKLKEEQHIKRHLHDCWQSAKAPGFILDADQKLYVELIEEEFKYLN